MNNRLRLILAVVALFLLFGGEGVPFAPSPKVDRVTYVYEKDQGAVPRGVEVALRELNQGGEILATEYQLVDGEAAPKQYQVAEKSANEAGIPALVVQAGESVVRVVKSPATKDEVLEAIP